MRLKIKSRMLPMISLLISIILVGILAPGSPQAETFELPTPIADASAASPPPKPLQAVPSLDTPSPFVQAQAKPLPLPNLAQRFNVPRQTERIAPPVARKFSLKPPVPVSRAIPVATMPALTTVPREVLTSRVETVIDVPTVPRISHFAKTTSQTTPAFARCWPEPTALLAQLQSFAETKKHVQLTTETSDALTQLSEIETLAAPECDELFAMLRQQSEEFHELALAEDHAADATALMRIHHAISRRLEVWQQVHAIAATPPEQLVASTHSNGTILDCLNNASDRMNELNDRKAWRQYAMIDQALTAFGQDNCVEAERRQLAREMMRRMGNAKLTDQQTKFFEGSEFVTLKDHLRKWTVGPVDYVKLLRDIEIFEQYHAPSTAAAIATVHEDLLWTDKDVVRELSSRLDIHYRNANIRIALSEQLINRVGPPAQRFRQPVDDYIRGASIRGMSDGSNRVYVRLLPDPDQIRFGIEAVGNGDSRTVAAKGPVVLPE